MRKRKTNELTIKDIACFVEHYSDFVCNIKFVLIQNGLLYLLHLYEILLLLFYHYFPSLNQEIQSHHRPVLYNNLLDIQYPVVCSSCTYC